jgi:hypothetical protein
MPCPRITPYQAYLIDNNLSVDALNAAYQEVRACMNSQPPASSSGARNPSLSSPRRARDPILLQVRQQASATWQQAHIDSLNEFDAIENALAQLARAPETHVLLMVSTGFLSGLMDAERTAPIDRAIHAGIVINALDAKGLWPEAPGRPFGQTPQTTGALPHATFVFETSTIGERNDAINEAMAEFASGTGGLFFHNRAFRTRRRPSPTP